MSIKSFKFVSPGVFINEIDNSFVPRTAASIGPVIVGRSARGLAMTPVKVESYADFVTMFGDTVPGGAGGDIYRYGNGQSPMYGTYAAKAFLASNVAPVTYVRLLGQQTTAGKAAGDDAAAGWRTNETINRVPAQNGGAYGLWLFTSGANAAFNLGTGSLAAIWYVDNADFYLSGTAYGGSINGAGIFTSADTAASGALTGANNMVIGADSDDLYTVVISGPAGEEKIRFGFDDSSPNFIRKKFNTNPQLVSASTFYTSDGARDYWLGETYEQELRDRGFTSGALGVIMSISKGATVGPFEMKKQASREGRSGWFIGQDLGAFGSYVPFRQQKLFRLIGRGHGEWLHKNCKVSIANIRRSTTTFTDYGTFSVLIRDISDTDNSMVILERFDNCNLDPSSPNYVARKIGNKYASWDENTKRLKTYGEYDNQSKFVYVEMNSDVDAGATDGTLLPFGYFGPPRFRSVFDLCSTGNCNIRPYGGGAGSSKVADGAPQGSLSNFFVTGGSGLPNAGGILRSGSGMAGTDMYFMAGAGIMGSGPAIGACTGSLVFPSVRLRTSASDGGLTDPTNAFFGIQTTRTAQSTVYDLSIPDFHRLLYAEYAGGGGENPVDVFATTGVEDYAYVFSLDDVVLKTAGGNDFFYQSGSRVLGTAYATASYTNLLDAQISNYTAPFWGGFDGFDIKKPDPTYNKGMSSTSTEDDSYIYHTWHRAMDTVSDPEQIDMNLLVAPGLTLDNLTAHQIKVCEERADAMAIIDLPNVYTPSHEEYKSSKAARLGPGVTTVSNDLRSRRLDSSYGATFYPWVQTRDERTGRMFWIPPSVAMMGVLASSEAATQIWFAPAGFNRGGLTDGAAGIPVTNVTERLTSKERDTLYENRINPIASFPSTGIVVFGQKTLQELPSALDRINVRRLVIYLKKQISILATQILFEQNVQATWNRFTALIEPFLTNVKTEFGITDYKLILDSSTTTDDLIDQNILYAKIMVKPARAIEYIAIDFVVTSTGASFDD